VCFLTGKGENTFSPEETRYLVDISRNHTQVVEVLRFFYTRNRSMLAEFTARLETKVSRKRLVDVFFRAFYHESYCVYLTQIDEDYFRRMLSMLKEESQRSIVKLLGHIRKESESYPNTRPYVAMLLDAIDDESLEDKKLDFFEIVRYRDIEVIRALLERKAHPSMRQHYSNVVFSKAIGERRADVADLVRARVDRETIRSALNPKYLFDFDKCFLVEQYTLLCHERFKDVVSLGEEFIIGVMQYLCMGNRTPSTLVLGKLGHELYKLQLPPEGEKRKTPEEYDGDESNTKRRKFENLSE